MTTARRLQIATDGEPVLRRPARAVGLIEPRHRQLTTDMQLTLQQANGVGIAAPQVFVGERLFIIHSRPNPRYPGAPEFGPLVMIDPQLLWQSAEVEYGWEGCLSLPGLRGRVPRAARIRIAYRDLRDEPHEIELEGFPARIFQHEFDHLEGILFPDRVDPGELLDETEFQRQWDAGGQP